MPKMRENTTYFMWTLLVLGCYPLKIDVIRGPISLQVQKC